MQYLGGKNRIRKQISAYLESMRIPGQIYFEPFCGGSWVLQEMSGIRIASDANAALITMYKALQNGWIPPDNVTEEEYRQYKKIKDINDPMTAFVGIGCSFAGRWFQGYARNSCGHNYASSCKNSLMKQTPLLRDVIFLCGSYSRFHPEGALIYCDPPYAGCKPYEACSAFDTNLFWSTMRLWAKNNVVIVSEYTAPDDFNCVLEIPTHTSVCDSKGEHVSTVEKLFMLRR